MRPKPPAGRRRAALSTRYNKSININNFENNKLNGASITLDHLTKIRKFKNNTYSLIIIQCIIYLLYLYA